MAVTCVVTTDRKRHTVRMRAWRALRAAGAAVLRDGIYLLPERADCRSTLKAIAEDVQAGGGSTHLMRAEPEDADFAALFDRSDDYAALLDEIRQASDELNACGGLETLRKARKLRKTLAGIAAIDFFGGEAQRQGGCGLRADARGWIGSHALG